MKRQDYKNLTWYPVTDDTYWAEEFPDEFPNCQTIVYCTNPNITSAIYTQFDAYLGWGTMAKYDEWVFMIIPMPSKEKLSKED
jgi:hypothetical protein